MSTLMPPYPPPHSTASHHTTPMQREPQITAAQRNGNATHTPPVGWPLHPQHVVHSGCSVASYIRLIQNKSVHTKQLLSERCTGAHTDARTQHDTTRMRTCDNDTPLFKKNYTHEHSPLSRAWVPPWRAARGPSSPAPDAPPEPGCSSSTPAAA